MTGSPVFSINFTNQKFQLTYYYPIMSRPWVSWLWDFYIMILLGVSVLMFMTIFMIFSLVGNFTNFSLLMQRFMINFPQNWLVWSGSRHMIVSSSWIFFNLWSLLKQDCWSLSVMKTLTGSRPEKSSKCHKTRFGFLSSPNTKQTVNQTLNLRSMKHFRIAWLFLNKSGHMIV